MSCAGDVLATPLSGEAVDSAELAPSVPAGGSVATGGGTNPWLNWVPSAMISATSSSVSRQAVPLPIATTPTWCLATRSLRATLASDRRFCGRMRVDHRLIEQIAVRSSTATLQPVRNPGSIARTTCLGIGGWSSKLRRFLANTSTACRSATSVRSRRTSRSMLGRMQSVERVDRGGAEQIAVGMAFEGKLAEDARLPGRAGRPRAGP